MVNLVEPKRLQKSSARARFQQSHTCTISGLDRSQFALARELGVTSGSMGAAGHRRGRRSDAGSGRTLATSNYTESDVANIGRHVRVPSMLTKSPRESI